MSRVRKVLIPLHDFSAGGTEIHAGRLAKEWTKVGVEVDFVVGASDGSLKADLSDLVRVTLLQPQVGRSMFSRLRLGRKMIGAIERIEPDIIFIPGNFHFVLAHAFRKHLPHIPIIGKVSNPLLPELGEAGLLPSLARPLMRAYLSPFSGLIAMSAGLETECRKLAGPGLWQTTIFDPTIPDAVAILPIKRFSPSRGPLRLIAIGRIEPQKNMSLAVDTLRCLLPDMDSVLTIVGDGADRAQIEARVKALGLAERVRFTGFIRSVTEELDKADVLLVTSKYEGGPATAVEALARGVPVVSTDCSYFLRDILSDPQWGTIAGESSPAALADAIRLQISERKERPSSIESTLSKCRYSVSASAYLRAFEMVAARHDTFFHRMPPSAA